MKWEIVDTAMPNKAGLKSDFPTMDEYFSSFNLARWSEIIEVILRESRFNLGQYEDLIYPAWLDGGDLADGLTIPDDSVMYRIWLNDDDRFLIKKKDFESAILALASRILALHSNDPDLAQGWADGMRKSINKLEQKVAQYSL